MPSSFTAKTGCFKLTWVVRVGSRTALRPARASVLVCALARFGLEPRLGLLAPLGARRRAARSSSSWHSRISARLCSKRSGRTRPVGRTRPAFTWISDVTASTAVACGFKSAFSVERFQPLVSPTGPAGSARLDRPANSSRSACQCRLLGRLATVVTVRGTRLLLRFTSTVNGFAR